MSYYLKVNKNEYKNRNKNTVFNVATAPLRSTENVCHLENDMNFIFRYLLISR